MTEGGSKRVKKQLTELMKRRGGFHTRPYFLRLLYVALAAPYVAHAAH